MSEQDRIAFDALNRLIEQDHKVPQGSMTLGIISERLNHRYKTGFIEGYKAAAAEANKRIEAIESEVAELKDTLYGYDELMDADDKKIVELQANNHDLREVLEYLLKHGLWANAHAKNVIQTALSKAPAESLAKHDDELIEKCALICEREEKDCYPESSSTIAAAYIRALKEVK